ncbi:hypothetical protein QWY84_11120 [Aquisalimonas lutea]|uniref:hypothetical protein n=1 Tax=Aquisalimonas lutea TaxID=1327750 RepID=UPI0025B5BEE7|nr:hypothetical protein [Aquisalimonas lutea]MDN3518162.1 hypothetical protein [Aquisalimonas lutea]
MIDFFTRQRVNTSREGLSREEQFAAQGWYWLRGDGVVDPPEGIFTLERGGVALAEVYPRSDDQWGVRCWCPQRCEFRDVDAAFTHPYQAIAALQDAERDGWWSPEAAQGPSLDDLGWYENARGNFVWRTGKMTYTVYHADGLWRIAEHRIGGGKPHYQPTAYHDPVRAMQAVVLQVDAEREVGTK